MPIGERRKGHVGIFATTILMVSVVLFLGSLFYLTTNNPWNSGSKFDGEKYVTTSISDKQPEIQQIDQKELNLTSAVADLESVGCVFTVYTGEYTTSKGIRIEYDLNCSATDFESIPAVLTQKMENITEAIMKTHI